MLKFAKGGQPPCDDYALLVTGSVGLGLSDECSDVDLIFIVRNNYIIERSLVEEWISKSLSIPYGTFELIIIDECELSLEYARGDPLAWCIFHTGQLLDWQNIIFNIGDVPSPFCGDSEFQSCIWAIKNYKPFQLQNYHLNWIDIFLLYAIIRHYIIVSSSGFLQKYMFTVQGLWSISWLKDIEGFDDLLLAVRQVKGGFNASEHVPEFISSIARCVIGKFVVRYYNFDTTDRVAQKRGARWLLTAYAFTMASSACRYRWNVSAPLVNSNQSINHWGESIARSYPHLSARFFTDLFDRFILRLCDSDPSTWDKICLDFCEERDGDQVSFSIVSLS